MYSIGGAFAEGVGSVVGVDVVFGGGASTYVCASASVAPMRVVLVGLLEVVRGVRVIGVIAIITGDRDIGRIIRDFRCTIITLIKSSKRIRNVDFL